MDQRGGGKSTPAAELCENTTQLLVSDIEALRTKLQIAKWHIVFGGSWGSTLSLAYAQTHPDSVGALVLRGIFLGEAWEADWTLRGTGAAVMFPDAWDKFIEYLSPEQREDPLASYHKLLLSDDPETQLRASRPWNRWESSVSYLELPEDAFAKDDNDVWNLQHARMEAHYFVNGCFLRDDKALMKKENIDRIANIPSECRQRSFIAMTSELMPSSVHCSGPIRCRVPASSSLGFAQGLATIEAVLVVKGWSQCFGKFAGVCRFLVCSDRCRRNPVQRRNWLRYATS